MELAEGYRRFLTPMFKPFNPLKLAEETEKIVTRPGEEGLERNIRTFTQFQFIGELPLDMLQAAV